MTTETCPPNNNIPSPSELLYRLHDKPPFWETLTVAVQHVLAVFGGIIAPPLIIANALKCDYTSTAYLVSMALFVSGLATLIQVVRVGPLGSGLLSIQGTSFTFVSTIIAIGERGGLPLILGVCAAGSLVEMLLSRLVRYLKHIITPTVTGVVVTLIGLSLIKVAVTTCAGGTTARNDGTFASFPHLALAAFVFLTILLLNASRGRLLRMASIIIGLLVGYAVALCLGRVSFPAHAQLFTLQFPIPFYYGMRIDLPALVPIAFLYVITTIETIGDITATSQVSREPIEGPLYLKRISGGILADGFNSLLAAVFNTFPNTTFSQNNGVIQMTGVASRRVGIVIACLLIILGLVPAVANLIATIPQPVLGGATLLMFGTVAAAGIRILASQPLDRRAMLIIAAALAVGLGVELVPEILHPLPDQLRIIFRSGITTGGLTALLLQAVLPRRPATPPAPATFPPL
ncbi:MAG: purine permease [bacterium]|nr:purine permease [bacterium]